MRRVLIPIILIWIMLVGSSLVWNLSNDLNAHQRTAYRTARGLFNFIVITREWNARYGGLFAQVSGKNQPDPALKDIRLSREEQLLTKINPALMTRQLAELAERYEGVKFRITGLQPLRPEEVPTPEEEKAFAAFSRGETEIWEVVRKEEGDFFLYMAPLKGRKACLQCHDGQDYREEGSRGGVSITIPFDYHPSFRIIGAHLLVGFAGLLGIGFLGYRLNQVFYDIKRQTEFDNLTGVYNYRGFTDRISREIGRCLREQAPLSVLICDVDRFKEYNDVLGHNKGNECLIQVAGAIKGNLKRPGDFCARYGGEEFIVVLPNTDQAGALHLAGKIKESVCRLEIPHDNAETGMVTISIGVTTLPENLTMCLEKLVGQADKALDQAKAKGLNQVSFFAESEDY